MSVRGTVYALGQASRSSGPDHASPPPKHLPASTAPYVGYFCLSRAQADAVDDAVAAQLATLQTRDVAAVAIAKGLSVVCPDMDSAVAVTNGLAPEHLEVQTADSVALASRLTAFGGIFIGPNTAEVFGDYGAGPNHVLPTGGTGKYTGGLSVFTFLRIRTWLRSDTPAAGADREAFEGLVRDTAALARLEGLRGHERAALRRSDNATALIAAAELEAAEAKDE